MRAQITSLRLKAVLGFTLIEVMISIAILALIVGGVMASVQACLQATDILRRERLHQGQSDALHSLLRNGLMTLPSDVVMRYAPSDARNGPIPLRFLSRQPALVFTATPWKPGRACESVMIWRKEANGTFTLGVGNVVNDNVSFLPADTLASSSFSWIPLLHDIRNVTFRFYDSTQEKWLDTWENDGARPVLVELNMEFADLSSPFRGVFWVGSQRIRDTATGRGNPIDAGIPSTPPPALITPDTKQQTSGGVPGVRTGASL